MADVVDPVVTNFYDYLDRYSEELSDKRVWNFDECRIYFDMVLKTLHWKGAKSVVVKTTGHEQTGFTVGLTCNAQGGRMKPLVIFKGTKSGPLSRSILRDIEREDIAVKVLVRPKAGLDEEVMHAIYTRSGDRATVRVTVSE
jgi:hypothetical protein